MTQMNLLTKQKETHRERTYGCQRGKMGGRDSRGLWNDHVQTAVLKMNNQQGPMYST